MRKSEYINTKEENEKYLAVFGIGYVQIFFRSSFSEVIFFHWFADINGVIIKVTYAVTKGWWFMSKEKSRDRIPSQARPIKKKRSNKWIVVILIGLIVVVSLIVGITVISSLEKKPNAKEYNLVVTPENIEQAIANLEDDQYTPIGSYEVNMNSEWTFADGLSASDNAYVGNSMHNTNSVYFTVTTKNDNEVVLTSPVIPVGSHLENIKLDKELAAGKYDAVVKYFLLDAEGKEVSNVSVAVTITIQK